MNVQPVLDVSSLPDHDVGYKAPVWWGVVTLLCIEGTVFALALASYFYLRMRYTEWPPADAGPPDLAMPLINLAVIVASWYPQWRINQLVLHNPDKPRVRRLLWIATWMGLAATVLRFWDFRALNCDWTEHSYGSIVWALVFLHTIHLVTSTIETGLMAWYVSEAELDVKHRSDINVNAVYWGFVVMSWVVLFIVIWGAGRVL